jgi:hypothetical protein
MAPLTIDGSTCNRWLHLQSLHSQGSTPNRLQSCNRWLHLQMRERWLHSQGSTPNRLQSISSGSTCNRWLHLQMRERWLHSQGSTPNRSAPHAICKAPPTHATHAINNTSKQRQTKSTHQHNYNPIVTPSGSTSSTHNQQSSEMLHVSRYTITINRILLRPTYTARVGIPFILCTSTLGGYDLGWMMHSHGHN